MKGKSVSVLPLQRKETEKSINNLLNAIQQGILTPSTKSRLEELEAAKEDLEIRIANEKLAKPKLTAEFVTMWLERFRKLDMRKKEHRQQLIDTFVNSIYLFDDKLTLHINYKDGTKTVTFDEMKAALDEQAGVRIWIAVVHHVEMSLKTMRTGKPVLIVFRDISDCRQTTAHSECCERWFSINWRRWSQIGRKQASSGPSQKMCKLPQRV